MFQAVVAHVGLEQFEQLQVDERFERGQHQIVGPRRLQLEPLELRNLAQMREAFRRIRGARQDQRFERGKAFQVQQDFVCAVLIGEIDQHDRAAGRPQRRPRRLERGDVGRIVGRFFGRLSSDLRSRLFAGFFRRSQAACVVRRARFGRLLLASRDRQRQHQEPCKVLSAVTTDRPS